VDNWRQVLLRSASVWFAAASNFCFVMAGAVYVFADELGDWKYIELVAGLCVLGFLCVAIVPLARIIKQPSLHRD
jgi:hypothetical protein